MKKIFIIAGEKSGDKIGALILSELRKNIASDIKGVGGVEMRKQGLDSLFPMEDISLMGFVEIIPHILRLRNLINLTVNYVKEFEPDILITIDSPGFATRVAQRVKKFSTAKLVHIVAPSVWAYKPERASKFASLYDLLLALLPFEAPYFEKEQLKTSFVGHFMFEQEVCNNANIFREKHHIPKASKMVCITPGSRVGEVKMHLPIFLDSISILREKIDVTIVIIASNPDLHRIITQEVEKRNLKNTIITGENHFEAYKSCNVALAKSGTNNLEIALHNIPMIICYKVHFFTWIYIKFKILIKYANLINIMSDKMIIPEFIQSECNPQKIADALEALISDNAARELQIYESRKILEQMKNPEGVASKLSVQEILKL